MTGLAFRESFLHKMLASYQSAKVFSLESFPLELIYIPVVVISPRPAATVGVIPLRAVVVGVRAHNGEGVACSLARGAGHWCRRLKRERGQRERLRSQGES